jgi:ABC-type multidrug transport system fused ATPase/permease subunit
MWQSLTKLYSLFSRRAQRHAFVLLGVMVLLGLVETAGVASVLPLLMAFGDKESIKQNAYLNQLYEFMEFTSPNHFYVFLASLLFFITAIRIALSITMTYASTRFASMRAHELKVRMVEIYLNRPYSWHIQQHSAKLGKAVSSEAERVVNSLLIPTITIAQKGITAALILSLMIAATPRVVLIFMALAASFAFIYYSIRSTISRIGTQFRHYTGELAKVIQESFSGIKDIKAYGVEQNYVKRIADTSLEMATRRSSLQVYRSIPRHVMEMISIGGLLLAIIYILQREDGSLASVLPILGFCAFAALRLMPMIESIYAGVVTFRFDKNLLDSVHADLVGGMVSDAPSERGDAGASVPVPANAAICLESVTFSYPATEVETLKEVSLVIAPGTVVAIIGSTGSGKSTIVDILLGLLAPQSGHLRIGDIVARGPNLSGWRRLVGYVPQHIFLADQSLAANIALGVPHGEIDMAAVERAARAAQLHEVVESLPQGYATPIGDRGVRLSGGQRQRIGIARALYRDPAILILDEATSALDNITESAVMKELASLEPRKTIIMVTHRLTSVQDCDHIWLMDGGRIISHGTFAEMAHPDKSAPIAVG